MGVGLIGTQKELAEMVRKEGHPNPESVQNFGELLNWVADQVAKRGIKRKGK